MALTRFQIKVYSELGEKERINFVTNRKSRQFNLGGTILAERFVNNAGVTSNTRITIKRTDQFNKDGSNRIVYRRVGFTRFVNMDEDRLAADLGYDIDQVIAYINQQANLEEDGFEFKFNGTHVGYADTVNFVGFLTASLSNGIVDITPNPVGVETAGGFVGAGITCFNFIGSGVSFVTVPTAGVTTVCLSGGSGIGTQFADEEKLKFGTDPTAPNNTNHQLEIWSSIYTNGGSGNTALGANIIKSASTARNLRVQTNASFVVEDTDGKNFIRASHPDWINVVTPSQIPGGKGSVELYYLDDAGDSENLDGLRLYTTGVGVSIVGDLRVSGDLHVAGSGGGNPVTSGVVTGTGNTTLTLTLNDASTVDIDVTNLVDVHSTTINEFQWYQQYLSPGAGFSTAGPGITTVNPGFNSNPYYYGTQLKPYQEMTWTHSLSDVGAYWVGIWGGSTTYSPGSAGNVALWEKSLVFRNSVSDGHHIDNAGTTYDSTGFSFVNGVTQYTSINNNTSLMRLRYNGDTNKLEIWKGSTPVAIATATVAEDGNPITISSVLSTNSHLPGITTVQYYVDQTKFKYFNSQKALENSTHDLDQGVVFWGEPLHRGEELTFSVPGNSLHIGTWSGGTGVTGSDNVRNKSNWDIKWQYNHNRTDWEAATTSHGPTGVEMAKDIQVDNGTYSIRWDYDTNKLQLWEIIGAGDWLISESQSTISGITTQYLYLSRGGDDTGGSSLPTLTHRASEWTLQSHIDPVDGNTVHSGVNDDEVWKSNRSLKPGMKLKTTFVDTAKLQYWGVGYGGTTGMGDGPLNPYNSATGSWRINSSNVASNQVNSTINTNYTAYNTGNTTLDLTDRNISWRYNSDNSWDLFDEDTDELILTGDNNLSGEIYPYLFGATDSPNYQTNICQWEWEWNKKAWFMEYRDWNPDDNANAWLILTANGHALQEATDSLILSNGYYSIGSGLYNVTWGEKMRPGQEFVWTQLNTNQNGSTKNNMIIGVLDSTYKTYTCGVKFWRGGYLKDTADQDAGFTVGVGGTLVPTAGTSMRLRYEYGTNKLVCYSINAGVRSKLAESTSALDGNPIFISMGGDSTRLPSTSGVEVYGWEIAHEPPNYYNPWKNWRIGSFPENTSLPVGIASTGGVLNWAADQVWRHKDGLAPGYKMHWLTPSTHPNGQIGQWSTGNASSGLSNLENNDFYWDWSWQHNTNEEIDEVKGWSFNTSNSNYSATKWTDPNPGSTRVSLRYHSDNSMDLYDESNDEVIITKSADNDGNPIYISWTVGGATSSQAQMIDDFFGGGDVGIALTTTNV